GYGVVVVDRTLIRAVECGCIRTKPGATLAERVEQIFKDAESVIAEYKPDEIVVENAFYSKNVRSTLVLGHVRGVLLLAGRRSGAHVVELSPKEIKRFVTGNGAASKQSVKYMVAHILKLKDPPKSDDASDALAGALAHALCITRG
ncbi:MAG: crossover junction endodeoxyribonuclease RuvC, partial [Fibrobacterota bacterium]